MDSTLMGKATTSDNSPTPGYVKWRPDDRRRRHRGLMDPRYRWQIRPSFAEPFLTSHLPLATSNWLRAVMDPLTGPGDAYGQHRRQVHVQ